MSRLAVPAAAFGLLVAGAAVAHGVPQADLDALQQGGLLAYVWLGAKHMVTGYDHLLFLFGVMFFLTRLRDIVMVVTAFTIGHSITLTIGTLLGITINYFLIDAFIALTVCYKAIENLDGFRKYLGVATPRMTVMVFAFGLVHGLGLATRLQQVPLSQEGLVARILAFNLGVEIGQVAALVVIAAGLALWRRRASFARFSTLANQALLAVGALLFLFQLHGYSHVRYPEDFGFSEDLHRHAHQDMELEEQRARHTDSLD